MTLVAINLVCVSYVHCYSLSKFGSLGTFEHLTQGHEIDKVACSYVIYLIINIYPF